MISVVKSMSKENRRNSIWSHSLQTHRDFNSDERDLGEHFERRAQQAMLGENSVPRRLFLKEYKIEIQNSEPRNSEHAMFESQRELESHRRQLLKGNQWADQAQRERIHLCGESEMKDHLHQESYARSCREIEELKTRIYHEEILKNNENWKNFLRSMIRNHEQ